jgi:hypothetical protein
MCAAKTGEGIFAIRSEVAFLKGQRNSRLERYVACGGRHWNRRSSGDIKFRIR